MLANTHLNVLQGNPTLLPHTSVQYLSIWAPCTMSTSCQDLMVFQPAMGLMKTAWPSKTGTMGAVTVFGTSGGASCMVFLTYTLGSMLKVESIIIKYERSICLTIDIMSNFKIIKQLITCHCYKLQDFMYVIDLAPLVIGILPLSGWGDILKN